MKILGVDYGRKKVGTAIAEGFLAEPLGVIKVNGFNDAVKKVLKVAAETNALKLVVGISEGKMEEESKKFTQSLRQNLGIPVETFDESLSSKEAIGKSIEAGIKRSKRKSLEDAYAAAIMLQNYLDIRP